MPSEVSDAGSLERELRYYRRECNDLGARLLRLQEEQSQAFRDARRSRTVVKLLREAYRLGDVNTSGEDVGGPMLEIVVDNTLCDRAALLREEPLGSGVFLPAHSIGLASNFAQQSFVVGHPPNFAYTSAGFTGGLDAEAIVAILGLPYMLWAFDSMSGMALVLANRSEENTNRPFEAGDQELIEGALSVYLDVIYRKQVEAQLRLAKQAAEIASNTRSALLETLTLEFRPPLQSFIETFALMQAELAGHSQASVPVDRLKDVADASEFLLGLLDDAARLVDGQLTAPVLAVEWVSVGELVRAASRTSSGLSVRRGVDIETIMPRRRTTLCVDRRWMQHVLQYLISNAVRLTLDGGAVRIAIQRRSDGSLDMLIKSGAEGPHLDHTPSTAIQLDSSSVHQMGSGIAITRKLVEAHEGMLFVEMTGGNSIRTRINFPARVVRDEDVTPVNPR